MGDPDFLAAIIAVGVIAFAVGQFRTGRTRAMQVALDTAQAEINIQRDRGDRLEREINQLQLDFKEVRDERNILRALVTGEVVSPAFQRELTGVANRIIAAIHDRYDEEKEEEEV